METLNYLADGFAVALTLENLGFALLGCFLGTIIGALPGLGPSNGVAILIPLAFALDLDATAALILLTSVYYGAMYGGRISSILLNIPGDEPALMTTLDGYPMAKQGKAGEALVLSGVASFVGGFFATVGLVLLAPVLKEVAKQFGSAEYFALYALAFATLGGIANRNQAKAAMAAAFGLAIATIGLDDGGTTARFTFNDMHLMDGIDFLVAIVGLFAIAEVFLFLEHQGKDSAIGAKVGRITVPLKTLAHTGWTMARSTVIGFLCGILPGAGASLGSFVAYTTEKKISDKKKTFGTGDPRGVAAPEAGNNAAAGGALVPMLTLGVPGSGTTAVLLAILLTLNITPGPQLFEQNPDVVWGLIAALFIGNFMLLILNIPLVGLFVRLLSVPSYILMPAVAMIASVSIYSISGSVFDLMTMIAFGVIGYLCRKLDIPTVPIILGILLGKHMEGHLRDALAANRGDWFSLIDSPISIGLWIAAILGFVAPLFIGKFLRPRRLVEEAKQEQAEPD